MEIINSSQNQYLKYLKKLYKTRKRKKENVFILEGKNIIEEACNLDMDFEYIFMTPEFHENNKLDIKDFSADQINIKYIEKKLLEKIADTVSPQGIIAIVKKPEYKFEEFKNTRNLLILDQIQDPGNMGTLIRTAVAAGMDGIIALKGCVDIYNLKVIRATMGTIFALPILTRIDLQQFKNLYQKNNFNLITAESSRGEIYSEVEYKKPLMIVIGNEARGVRSEIIDLSDRLVKIPVFGDIDSLNAAIAGGIILYKSVEKNCTL